MRPTSASATSGSSAPGTRAKCAASRCWCRIPIQVSRAEAELAEAQADLIRDLGLGVDRIGAESLVVREIPAALQGADAEGCCATCYRT